MGASVGLLAIVLVFVGYFLMYQRHMSKTSEYEEVLYAYQTVRDQLVFTNKRIIAIDVQGITGKHKSFSTMPYSKVQYFSVQTPGHRDNIVINGRNVLLTLLNVLGFKCTLSVLRNINIELTILTSYSFCLGAVTIIGLGYTIAMIYKESASNIYNIHQNINYFTISYS